MSNLDKNYIITKITNNKKDITNTNNIVGINQRSVGRSGMFKMYRGHGTIIADVGDKFMTSNNSCFCSSV